MCIGVFVHLRFCSYKLKIEALPMGSEKQKKLMNIGVNYLWVTSFDRGIILSLIVDIVMIRNSEQCSYRCVFLISSPSSRLILTDITVMGRSLFSPII